MKLAGIKQEIDMKVWYKKTNALASVPERAYDKDFCYDVVATSEEELAPGIWKYGIGLSFRFTEVVPRAMKHIASCSFGKDSIATILLALEHGEPLDEAVFVEVMFDHARNISGEIPEHIDWIYSTAIPRLETMGVRSRVLRSEKDYIWYFKYFVTRGKRAGKCYGFPIGGKCLINRDCKINPIRRYLRDLGDEVTQYIGIAADEPKRLARLRSRNDKPCKTCKVSLLAKYGYTEAMARELCERRGLLSPIYKTDTRGGCWFCPNARISYFCRLRREHPDLWAELEALSLTPDLSSYGFTWKGKTLQEVEREMDLHDAREEAESLQLKLF